MQQINEQRIMEQLDEIAGLLRQLLLWTRVGAVPKVKELLEATLTKDEERLAYELTDGKQTQVQIAATIKVTQPTVSNWWKKWNGLGLTMESTAFPGRQMKCFSLLEFGIRVPSKAEIAQTSNADSAQAE